MSELEQINNFVVVNSSCAKNCHDMLSSMISKHSLEEGFARADDFLFGFTPLFDIDTKRIGYIGIWFGEALLKESLLLRASLSANTKSLHVNDIQSPKSFQTNPEITIR